MVQPWQIDELVQRIATGFAPDCIVLFGSFAYGKPTEDSDVDLLVVMPFEGKAFRKASEIAHVVRSTFPIDIIVRDPMDVTRRYAEGDPLIREAMNKGRVLHERSHS